MKDRIAFTKRFTSLLNKPNGKQNLIIFLLCLFCSASFWLFIKLSRDERITFVQPIKIINISSENVLSDLSHSAVRFTLQAPGIRLLLTQFLHTGDTLMLDATQMGYTERNRELWHYMPANDIRRYLARLPLMEGAIVSVAPDTLFARFLFASEKKVPVWFAGSISFAPMFGQKDSLRLYPDSVTVRGPGHIVDTLTAIRTKNVQLQQISQSVIREVALENPAFTKGLSLGTTQVSLEIPIVELKEATFVLPISIRRTDTAQRPDANILIFPAQASVRVFAPVEHLQELSDEDFEVFVHCPIETPVSGNRLQVFVKNRSAFVRIGNMNPQFVEFVISE